MSSGENNNTETRTIPSFAGDVEFGIAVNYLGVPTKTNVFGVTMEQCVGGKPGLVAVHGSCQIQAANASPVAGNKVELDTNGRAIALAAGAAVGVADDAGLAAVSGKYKLISINLFAYKGV